jgi:hypothetical protein
MHGSGRNDFEYILDKMLEEFATRIKQADPDFKPREALETIQNEMG